MTDDLALSLAPAVRRFADLIPLAAPPGRAETPAEYEARSRRLHAALAAHPDPLLRLGAELYTLSLGWSDPALSVGTRLLLAGALESLAADLPGALAETAAPPGWKDGLAQCVGGMAAEVARFRGWLAAARPGGVE